MAVRRWIGGDGTGPQKTDWSRAANWSGATVPINADTVIIDGTGDADGVIWDIAAGLNQSAVALALLRVDDTYTGLIGTATSPLQVGAAAVWLGYNTTSPAGSGSPRINLDLGTTTAYTCKILSTCSTSEDEPLAPVRVIGGLAACSLYMGSGTASWAIRAGEVARLDAIYLDGASGGAPNLTLGIGCIAGTFNQNGGTFLSLDNDTSPVKTYTDWYQTGGTATVFGGSLFTGSGSTGLRLYGVGTGAPTFVRRCIGTISNLVVGGKAKFDGTQDARPLVVSASVLFSGAQVDTRNGRPGSYTATVSAVLSGCGTDAVTIRTEVGDKFPFK